MIFWNKILERLNATSKTLQDPKMNLLKGVSLLKSLSEFILMTRDNFESVEVEAKSFTDENQYKDERCRSKKRKIRFDETIENEVVLRGRNLFIIDTINVVCDTLNAELNRPIEVYKNILSMFTVFFDKSMKETEVDLCIDKLIDVYKVDIHSAQFKDEMLQF